MSTGGKDPSAHRKGLDGASVKTDSISKWSSSSSATPSGSLSSSKREREQKRYPDLTSSDRKIAASLLGTSSDGVQNQLVVYSQSLSSGPSVRALSHFRGTGAAKEHDDWLNKLDKSGGMITAQDQLDLEKLALDFTRCTVSGYIEDPVRTKYDYSPDHSSRKKATKEKEN